MYHVGHKNVIKNSKKEGDLLFVGIASDDYVKKKNKTSLLDFESRKKLLESDPLVDYVFAESSLKQWPADLHKYDAAKIMISKEHEKEILGYPELDDINIQYFDRTPNVSTSDIKERLKNSKVILTYGTFDLLHHGHSNIFERAKKLGDVLIVGVSTDEFNNLKGKKSKEDFATRINNVSLNEHVDFVIPELSWDQKSSDITKFNVDTFTMGSDWKGKFDELIKLGVNIEIIDRTPGISSTQIRNELKKLEKAK